MSTKHRIEAAALIVGYAMSRLDRAYLVAFGQPTWKQAFAEAGAAFGIPPASFKNLRDEFDPLFGKRSGWHGRSMRSDRLATMNELAEVSEPALIELAKRALARDDAEIEEVLARIVRPERRATGVADRLLTGRLAEEHFLKECESIVGFKRRAILDMRDRACGYDFGIRPRSELAIEVKGIRELRGPVLFTDREWREAGDRRADYWVVVVGGLDSTPVPRLIVDPLANLEAECAVVRSVSAVWKANVSVADQTPRPTPVAW